MRFARQYRDQIQTHKYNHITIARIYPSALILPFLSPHVPSPILIHLPILGLRQETQEYP
jgi:hypothetical protein